MPSMSLGPGGEGSFPRFTTYHREFVALSHTRVYSTQESTRTAQV